MSSLVAVPAPPPRPARPVPVALTEVARAAGAPAVADASGVEVTHVQVTGVTHDSRAVRPGDLYAALPGSNAHGATFTAQAVAAGAVAVLTDAAGRELVDAAVPVLVVDDPRAVLGHVAATVHGHPAERLLLLGVTGTNGKTTTCYLLESALRSAGRRTGLVGTVETRVGDERVPSVRTTPESTDLQALLALMVERRVQACAMEVSSHALALHRVDGIRYDVAGFTNLSQDHLDFHPDLEHYYAAKASLFTPQRSRRAVVCVDDLWGRRVAADAAAAGLPVTTVATPALDDPALTRAGAAPEWRAVELAPADDGVGTRFVLLGPDGHRLALVSPLPGDFNVANTAVAALVLLEAGLDQGQVADGLAAASGVPGRMEVVPGPPDAPLAVVDYAHTPEAVAVALRALRGRTAGRLVVVLGAGGDRDAGKRPAMGGAAVLGADAVVVTDDNPRSEDPAAIRAAVLRGAAAAADGLRDREVVVAEVGDRREAVATALRLAGEVPGSTVLVAGKGHETGQEVAGTVHPFDDRTVLADLLATAGVGT